MFQLGYKVTVLGAAGGIGQPLSLLLKQSKLVTQLSLYDIQHALGVAADISHIDTVSKVIINHILIYLFIYLTGRNTLFYKIITYMN